MGALKESSMPPKRGYGFKNLFSTHSSSSISSTNFGSRGWSVSILVSLEEDLMVSFVALLGGDINLGNREDFDIFHEVKEWLVEGVNEVGYS
jgi:hypothetical protein